ncbi:melatonin receptor type 1B-B-like [Brachionus plicatilis]|uniref:Melatonin receptor type 1B-B-like n=1 Tax=Brachionus plicatilis TaxID=10195 RepID=A0A3M7QZM6_BRAPC|nr:melatonin receptor type 1B-B-like [Brachionus plicatilis]
MVNFSNDASVNLSTKQPIEEYGGLAFLLDNLQDYLPYSILSACGTAIGIIGNLLIIGAVLSTKELHSSTNMLVFNLALADLTISTMVDSFTVVGVLQGKSYFDQRPILCHFVAGICLVACETSLMNIGFLAINRYVHICHHSVYNKIFTIKKTLIYCCITWMIGISIDFPNLLGWGGHYYDLKTLNCVWNRLASFSYSLFFPLSSIVVPCILIAICYLRIFIYSSKIKSKVLASESSGKRKSSDLRKSLRIAKGLFASFTLFAACWMPYGLVVMTDYQDRYYRTAHMYTMSIAHLNSSLNPILYAVFNPAFQKGYVNFFRLLTFKRREVSITSKTHTMNVSVTNLK